MKTVRTIEEMRSIKNDLKNNHNSIGLVPTMGFLHEGHRQLIQSSRQENDVVVVSVFVNPLQFNQSSDLESYPRDFERDEKIMEQDGVDYVFYPTALEMYPRAMTISMSVDRRTDVLCGQSRPGHFEGVVTVLSKLFHIIAPTSAYFGLKDAQQFAVVDALVHDFNFEVNVTPVPTVREEDGLAMSSRNVNLETDEREEAKHIYQALLHGQTFIKQHDDWSRQEVINEVKGYLEFHITGEIDYIDCLSFPELSKDLTVGDDLIIAVAVYYKKARLIDNIILNAQGEFKYKGE
ncbi:pantoate--beta-alanine ligase [Tenuibacillus multivorans]|uniref:Pantothenate synthetase n=1 Tax=Tenuibacillus multivorans TaxID=237069 RepID=A0A1H0CSR7_9BACI|nr:pantoate--beta-alanine ligase [Tenuibacillus multivorans]GEL76177.1 pantothenate synthetase [Tenuibacillus multivorans]SDN60919.1 pantoate--beta-alanine ligase [Tenuibacillus multivorans]